MSGPTPAAPATGGGRIAAFDGMRGVAAFTVLIYHYFALAHPEWTPNMAADPRALVDTPVYLLWNGAFAVALFFVLSGYVIAAAADRRSTGLVAATGARYLRLAVPAAASCILAWIWLALLPEQADTMAATLDDPSRWLAFTYQDDIKGPVLAVADGLAGVFVRGYSRFNNVLWTLKIELFGSLAVFVLYHLTRGRVRLVLLALATVAVPPLTEPSYLAFGLGAMLYEAQRAGILARVRHIPGLIAVILIAGLLFAFPGDGFHLRMGLPTVPDDWQMGAHRGYVHVIGAALLILAVLRIGWLSALFSGALPLWLGRMSFSLYLVHVPLLYTFVAWFFVETDIPSPLLFVGYVVTALGLASVFESVVDAPLMGALPGLRRGIDRRLIRLRMAGLKLAGLKLAGLKRILR